MLHWKRKAQWTALSSEALIVLSSFLSSVVLTLLSHPSCPPSAHRSILALKYLLSPLFSLIPRHQWRRRRRRRGETDPCGGREGRRNERGRRGRRAFTREDKTDLLRNRRYGDAQMCDKMEETAVTRGSFSDFPMEAKIHKLMLIEQPSV